MFMWQRLPLQARQPVKPARHSPEAQPMADGSACHCKARAGRQGGATRGTNGQVIIRRPYLSVPIEISLIFPLIADEKSQNFNYYETICY